MVNPQLASVKLKNPIEQQMMGRAGLFRQQNIEKRKIMSVLEWAELCAKDELLGRGVKLALLQHSLCLAASAWESACGRRSHPRARLGTLDDLRRRLWRRRRMVCPGDD